MKVKEIILDAITPTVLTRQRRMSNFVQNLALADVNKPLTNAEKAASIIWFNKMKKAADRQYAGRLKHQLAQTARV